MQRFKNRNLKRSSHLSSVSASRNKKLRIQHSESGSSSGPTTSASVTDGANALAVLAQLIQSGGLPRELQNQLSTLSQNTPAAVVNEKDENKENNSSPTLIPNNSKDLIHPDLFRFLKEHQIEAVKFLFDRVILKNGEISQRGCGAMLAHNMGLGKTFTIIAFLQAVLSNDILNKKISKILLVCPKNVIEHWNSELKNWIDCPGRRLADNIVISCMNGSAKDSRFHDVKQWYDTKDKQQILIIGYEMFGNLVRSGGEMETYLQNPGADLVIFDEAHRLKNNETQAYQLASNIKTARIIFLTGTPYQNNLMEFYSTLHLISPRLFVSKADFKSKFSDPIERGRSKDACAADVKQMQVLCKLLYKRTKGIIHRKGVQTLIDELDILKYEVTFMVRPSKLQKALVEKYLTRIDPETGSLPKKSAVKDHAALSRILTHPALFFQYANKDTTIDSMDISSKRYAKVNKLNLQFSNKLMLLIKIIKYSEKVGDKILVFSQSLATLNFIEQILNRLSPVWKKQNKNGWSWEKGPDYLRIDGGVDSFCRHSYQKTFNNSNTPQCRLLLISTKAGSLGTNMIGANRVVVFDACWNPTHDIQSLYRVYRLGQTKLVYIYRLVTSGTMEEIVYNRQIAKEATGHRVIDEEDINRHFTIDELKHLYKFKYVPSVGPPPIKGIFNDPLTSYMVKKYQKAIVAVVSHNSFFDDFNEDEISESDVKECEKQYKKEMRRKHQNIYLSESDSNDDDLHGF